MSSQKLKPQIPVYQCGRIDKPMWKVRWGEYIHKGISLRKKLTLCLLSVNVVFLHLTFTENKWEYIFISHACHPYPFLTHFGAYYSINYFYFFHEVQVHSKFCETTTWQMIVNGQKITNERLKFTLHTYNVTFLKNTRQMFNNGWKIVSSPLQTYVYLVVPSNKTHKSRNLT